MTKVKTVREHRNEFGDEQLKSVGDEYECPARVAAYLAAEGLVEVVDPA